MLTSSWRSLLLLTPPWLAGAPQWVEATVAEKAQPRHPWTGDGKQLVFLALPGSGRGASLLPHPVFQPSSYCTACC